MPTAFNGDKMALNQAGIIHLNRLLDKMRTSICVRMIARQRIAVIDLAVREPIDWRSNSFEQQ